MPVQIYFILSFSILVTLVAHFLAIRENKLTWVFRVNEILTTAYLLYLTHSALSVNLSIQFILLVISLFGFLVWTESNSEPSIIILDENLIERSLKSRGRIYELSFEAYVALFFIFLITWILLSTAYRLTINNQEPLYSFSLVMQLIGYALLSQKALEAWLCLMLSYLFLAINSQYTIFIISNISFAVLSLIAHIIWRRRWIQSLNQL